MPTFHYDPYQNPMAGTIAELMLRGSQPRAQAAVQIAQAQARAAENIGAANAQAQQQSGNVWASAAQNIGQSLAAIPGQMQQQKTQALEQQGRQQQLALGKMQLDTAARVEQASKQVSALMADPSVYNADGTINGKGLIAKMSAMPAGQSGPVEPPDARTVFGIIDPINESLLKARQSQQAAEQHRVDAVARTAAAVLEHGKPTAANPGGSYVPHAQIAVGSFLKSGLISQDEANQVLTGLVETDDPAIQARILQHFVDQATPVKPDILKPGEVAFDPRTRQPIPGMSVPEKPPAPSAASLASDAAAGKPGAQAALDLLQKTPGAEETARHNKELERIATLTAGRQEAAQAETIRHNKAMEARPVAGGLNAGQQDDVKLSVQGMIDGTNPPQLPGRASKDYTAIMAEAKRRGYDLAAANTDWSATQKHIATMNGAQQLRLNQAINALPEMLDSVDALAAKWKGGRFPILNRANLAAAKGGVYGTDVASIANQLDAQIADVTADLGNVYMGGNSPTDHALGLAGKSLRGDWNEKVLHDMVALAKQNVTIRQNSIRNTGVAGASANNPYAPPAAAAPVNPFRKPT